MKQSILGKVENLKLTFVNFSPTGAWPENSSMYDSRVCRDQKELKLVTTDDDKTMMLGVKIKDLHN